MRQDKSYRRRELGLKIMLCFYHNNFIKMNKIDGDLKKQISRIYHAKKENYQKIGYKIPYEENDNFSQEAFRILLYLHEKELIHYNQIPHSVIKMLNSWNHQKNNNSASSFNMKFNNKILHILHSAPAEESDDNLSTSIADPKNKDTAEILDLFLLYGFIVVSPKGFENTWSYKKTSTGDKVLRCTGYSYP